MIGLIITGHGNFGTGLTSSLDLIAGPQANYVAVDFVGEMTPEDLEVKLEEAMTSLNTCDGILVLSDLPGGSPFKTAVVCGQNFEKVEVIAGTNLPMLCEVAMARNFIEDLDTLVNMALTTGKDQVVKFEIKAPVQNDDLSDGI